MFKRLSVRLSLLTLLAVSHTAVMTAQDKLSGTATVSPTGAAVYSIPIETLKGIGDLKPSIGITYNSQTGNGLVGWGCNITGLSSITRGMKDWAHDNTVKGIDYNSNSCALYLDGKRLLLKSGTEGTDGCVYSPEGEPQTTVTLHSSLSSTSSWFEVDTSDGMVYEYGHIDGRQTISNPTAVTAWYVDKATNPLGQYISYTYDSSGRLSQETRTFDLQELTFGYSYDSYGRLSRRTYPQNVNVDYAYNDDYLVATAINGRNISYLKLDNGLAKVYTYGGRLINRGEPLIIDDPIFPNLGGTAQPMDWPQFPVTDSTDVDPGLIYYPDSLVNQPDPWGQALTDYYYVQDGFGTKSASYDSRGYLTSLGMHRGQATLRQMTFDFEDGTGNLLSRTGMGSQTEDFTYDDLDRLTNVSGSNYHSFTYDLNGNLDYKSGAGYLSYGTAHPHAAIGATNDGDIPLTPQSISYTPFGKILSITEGNYTMNFTYGPDEERWKTELTNGNSLVRTTIYGDNYEQVTDANGQTRHIYYLDGAVYVLDDGATSGRLYFAFTDHLGSITRLYSEYGNEVFAAEYDAWGKQTVTIDSLDFRRGYTGHEMMPEFNLINMNGRLYDPVLGRFLSPDNYVQLPDFSQSFNRYSYCLNNPLKYTDPDGEIAWFVVAAFAGGVFNVAFNMDNINDAGDFFKYFGVGAAAGVAGGYVGNLVTGAIATGGVIETSGIYGGLLIGGVSGATSGFILGGGNSWLINGNFNSFLSDAFIGFAIGGVTGALIGGVTGAINAHNEGRDLWTGQPKQPLPQVNIDTELMESVAPKLDSETLIFKEGNEPRIANQNLTNRLDELGIENGMEMSSSKALDKAVEFLGDKYIEKSPGRFVSSDNTRVFRMTDADILGKHAGAPHVNFEIMAPNPDPLKLGKPKVIINRHIYIK